MQSWSIILFFYNEEVNVAFVCQKAIDFLKPLPDHKKELLIIDDGSEDQSVKAVEKMMQNKS